MSAFRDLDEFFTDELRLPIAGTAYVIPGPDAEIGLWCQRLAEAGRAVAAGRTPDDSAELDDTEERELYQRLLGPAFEQMRAAGLSWGQIRHAALTVFFWIVAGTDAAARYWDTGGQVEASGEAPAPNRTARRHPSRASSATAGSTRTRGSTTTTTSAPTAANAARPARSRGPSSSAAGR